MSLTGVPPVQMPKNMGKMPMRLMGETPMLRRTAFFNGLLGHPDNRSGAVVEDRALRRFRRRRFRGGPGLPRALVLPRPGNGLHNTNGFLSQKIRQA